jgi:hypothetical protein
VLENGNIVSEYVAEPNNCLFQNLANINGKLLKSPCWTISYLYNSWDKFYVYVAWGDTITSNALLHNKCGAFRWIFDGHYANLNMKETVPTAFGSSPDYNTTDAIRQMKKREWSEECRVIIDTRCYII